MENDCNLKLVEIECLYHREEMIQGLYNLFLDQHGTDLEMQYGGQTVAVHQIVTEIFLLPKTRNSKRVDDASKNLLELLLEFMYVGHVIVQEEQLDLLLSLAVSLDFRLLVDTIEAIKLARNDKMEVTTAKCVLNAKPLEPGNKVDSTREESSDEDCNDDCYAGNIDDTSEDEKYDVPEAVYGNETNDSSLCHDPDFDVDEESSNCEEFEYESAEDSAGKRKSGRLKLLATNSRKIRTSVPECSLGSKRFKGADNGMNKSHDRDSSNHSGCQNTKGDPALLERLLTKNGNESLLRMSTLSRDLPRSKVAKDSLSASTTENDVDLLQCHLCSYRSPKVINFKMHMLNSHHINSRGELVTETHKCDDCDFQHVLKSVVTRHRLRKHCQNKLQCPHCVYQNGDKHQMQLHVKKRHLKERTIGIRHSCLECTRVFNSKVALNSHRKTHKKILSDEHGAANDNQHPHRCPHCNYGTLKLSNYQVHLFHAHHINNRGEKVETMFKCDECPYEHVQRSVVNRHRLRAHTKLEDLKCRKCDYTAKNVPSLMRHRQQMHPVIPVCALNADGVPTPILASDQKDNGSDGPQTFACLYCSYTSTKVVNYKNHLLSAHLIDSRGEKLSEKLKCDKCDYTNVKRSAINRHHRMVHDKEKNFACTQCKFRAFAKAQLSDHIANRHSAIKPVRLKPVMAAVCHVCAKTFAAVTSLQTHMAKMHEDGTDFECGKCDFKAACSTLLKHHVNAEHSDHKRRRHLCTICGHRAPSTYNLARHMVKHSGDKDHRCDDCGRAFGTKGILVNHRKTQHPEKKSKTEKSP